MEGYMLALPAEVLRDQVLPFLLLKEVVDLDTATCNKALRPEFLNRLEGVTLAGNLSTKLKPGVLKWLSTRNTIT